jgi:DNA-binding CsgD family transcriptional regulator
VVDGRPQDVHFRSCVQCEDVVQPHAGEVVSTAERSAIVGRDAELAALVSILGEAIDGPVGVLIDGDAGVGKTTLWAALVADARARSWHVLSSRPAAAETKLTFSGLADLLEPYPDAIESLPQPQRRAIEVALVREEAAEPLDPVVVHAAALGVVRALASARPVLLAVDDIQWLDGPSLRVLQYVVRRLLGDQVVVAVARRTGLGSDDALGLGRALAPERLRRVRIEPLAANALAQLLRARFELIIPPAQVRRIHRATDGNPFFALEIVRGLVARGALLAAGEGVPLPATVREAVGDRVARLPKRAREALLVAAALSAPTADLVAQVAGGAGGLDRAAASGVIAVMGGVIQFDHPLLAAAAYDDAGTAERRAVHHRIADLVTDQEERARHLALAAEGPDEDVAAELERAAVAAHARGAPDSGAELAELAVNLTPMDRTSTRGHRAWLAGWYYAPAGDLSRANRLLRLALDEMEPGKERAEAAGLLWSLPAPENDRLDDRSLLEQGAEDAREDPALAQEFRSVLLEADYFQGRTHDPKPVIDASVETLAVAERSGEAIRIANALGGLGYYRFISGEGLPIDLMERGLALAREHHFTMLDWGARDWAALLFRAGDLATAREMYEAMCREAIDTGYESFLFWFEGRLAVVECLAGNYHEAREHAVRAVSVAEPAISPAPRAGAHVYLANAEAHLGNLEGAWLRTEQALVELRRARRWVHITDAESVLGFIELSRGRHAEADAILWPAAERIEQNGVREPAWFRFVPDEIEALIALGDLDRAKYLLEPFEERALRLDRVWARAEGARCRALLRSSLGDPAGALEAIDEASALHKREPWWPFERGRTLLAAGEINRRARHKRLAREALERAVEIFDRLGARVWTDRARSELARIGGRAPAPLDLTPTERQVAELVATGMQNKEVASALFMSVNTVQSTLSHVYRKLGVRSRTELAARLGSDRAASH